MPDSAAFSPVKSSPLAGLPASFGGVELIDRPFVGKVILRGNVEDGAFAGAVAGVIGCDLPAAPNTTASGGACTVFWMGPNEWLIHCAEGAQGELVEGLRDALGGQHAAVVDVSDYYAVMRLSGDRTLEVLSKGTSLDLHPRAFPSGCCAQTLFGHATVLLHKLSDGVVDLQVRWTFAAYVWSYIVEGTREYRVSP